MRPSLRAIIWNDWPALASAIGIVVMWGLYIIYPLIKKSAANDMWLILLPAIATLILFGILAWRIWRIYGLFNSGEELTGKITHVHLVKDRGRVEYAYHFRGEEIHSWSPVHQSKRVLALRPGQSVQLLVNPLRPNRAIIKSLYL